MVGSASLPVMREDFMEFNSRRSPVIGRRGMVACTQPLASEVNLDLLAFITRICSSLQPNLVQKVRSKVTHSQTNMAFAGDVNEALSSGGYEDSSEGRKCSRCCSGNGSCPQCHRTLLHRSALRCLYQSSGPLQLLRLRFFVGLHRLSNCLGILSLESKLHWISASSRTLNHEQLDCCSSLRRAEIQCLGFSSRHWRGRLCLVL